MNIIKDEALHLQHRNGIRTTVAWIPGHIGIPENEEADRQAIYAAKHGHRIIEIPSSTLDANEAIKDYINHLWQEQWNNSTKALEYRNIEPLATREIKLTDSNRHREVIKTRLRFGKCCLNENLHKIGRHSDGSCDSCNSTETIEHYILECRNNAVLTNELKEICKRKNIQMNLCSVISDSDTLNKITDYISRSKHKL